MKRNVDRDDKSKNRQGIGHSETCIYGLITVPCLRFQNVSTKDETCIYTQKKTPPQSLAILPSLTFGTPVPNTVFISKFTINQ